MTTPSERLRSLYLAREFLVRLLSPQETPGVPLKIRREASARLKHYPSAYDLDVMLQEGLGGLCAPINLDTVQGTPAVKPFMDALCRDIATHLSTQTARVSRRDTLKKSKPKKAKTVAGKSNRSAGCWL